MQCLRHIALLAITSLAFAGCNKSSDVAPAAMPGMDVPASWGEAKRDFIENREGAPDAAIKSILDAEVTRYKGFTPSVELESIAETTAILLLDATDLRRGKEAAAGLTPDAQLAAMPPDKLRILLEVRRNGPVFVVRTREFDIADEQPATGG